MVSEDVINDDGPGPISGLRNKTRRVVGLGRAMSGEDFTQYYFDDFFSDFFFTWVACMAPHGGSEIGETFAVADRIDPGDPDSWETEWTRMGQRVEGIAKEARANGHTVSAHDAFMRAYTYYRAALFFLSPIDNPRYNVVYGNARRCFRAGAELTSPPIEPVSVTMDDGETTGYFVPAADDDTPRPTILVLGGGDTFVEDVYYFVGPAARKRGYNVAVMEVPGQGGTPAHGMVVEPDSERTVGYILDEILEYPSVDPDSLGGIGFSLGGYLVPRATAHDDRIKACVANSLITDFHAFLDENPMFWWLSRIEGTPIMSIIERLKPDATATMQTAVDTYKWRFGVDTIAEWLERARDFRVDPEDIDCPTLLVVGQEEYEFFDSVRRDHERAIEAIDQPHTDVRVLPSDLGVGGHSGMGNVTVLNQIIFDWFDEVFDVTDLADSSTQPQEPAPVHNRM